MTVYVDDMLQCARVGRVNARWSHMLADTHQELMSMAAELGLRPEWIQHEGTYKEHFDLVEARRNKAIRLGAVPISYPFGTARILETKKAAMTPTTEKGIEE